MVSQGVIEERIPDNIPDVQVSAEFANGGILNPPYEEDKQSEEQADLFEAVQQ